MRLTDKTDAQALKGPAVYFLRNEAHGLIKIGHSSNVLHRVRILQCGSSGPLALMAFVPGCGRGEERALHSLFAEDRDVGEWFRPAPDLLRLATSAKADEADAAWLRKQIDALQVKRIHGGRPPREPKPPVDGPSLPLSRKAVGEEDIARVRDEMRAVLERAMGGGMTAYDLKTLTVHLLAELIGKKRQSRS